MAVNYLLATVNFGHRARKRVVPVASVSEAKAVSDRILDEVDKVVVGKRAQTELLLSALAVSGHVLLEDVPGVGKTLLARTFSVVSGLSFKRIQFTPDLLPADVTGISVFNQKDGEFHWRPGPIFANIVLADEINRATPRTQSSLLEAMEELQVTTEGVTRPLPSPFMVIATQNPIEMEGTFPLPEAQLDRFLLKVSLGYPTREEEEQVLSRFVHDARTSSMGKPEGGLSSPIGEAAQLSVIRESLSQVVISDAITGYILSVVERTRTHQGLSLGASPRGALYLARLCKALAAIRGRDYVLPDDVKYLASPCLAHRVIPKAEAALRGKSGQDIIAEVLSEVPVPVGFNPDGK